MDEKIDTAADRVSDEIVERGLDFGGRHEDVATVLQLAVELGLITLT
jgi:hypothetical protein